MQKMHPYWYSWHRKVNPSWHSSHRKFNLIVLIGFSGAGDSSCWHSWRRKVNFIGISGPGDSSLLVFLVQEIHPYWQSWCRRYILIDTPDTGKSTLFALLVQEIRLAVIAGAEMSTLLAFLAQESNVNLIGIPDTGNYVNLAEISGTGKSTLLTFLVKGIRTCWYSWRRKVNLTGNLAQDCQSYWRFWRRWANLIGFQFLMHAYQLYWQASMIRESQTYWLSWHRNLFLSSYTGKPALFGSLIWQRNVNILAFLALGL